MSFEINDITVNSYAINSGNYSNNFNEFNAIYAPKKVIQISNTSGVMTKVTNAFAINSGITSKVTRL